MRWIPWLLGIAGVAQFAIMALVDPEGYVSLDMAYLVMWLALIGAMLSCWLGCGYGGGCGCCGDGCSCGDCGDCSPRGDGHAHGPGDGHEGHGHGPGGHSH